MTPLDILLTSIQPLTRRTPWREAWRIAACRAVIVGYVLAVAAVAVGTAWGLAMVFFK